MYDYKGLKQYRIISPDELKRSYPTARILISTWAYEEECKQSLLELGLTDANIYYLSHWERIPPNPDSLYKDGYYAFPDIKLSEDEVFIDGGAHIGDTVDEFLSATKRNFKAIYAKWT